MDVWLQELIITHMAWLMVVPLMKSDMLEILETLKLEKIKLEDTIKLIDWSWSMGKKIASLVDQWLFMKRLTISARVVMKNLLKLETQEQDWLVESSELLVPSE